ncbi:MAG: 5-formyltetrahydrofolate cyclo-ligase [Phycisphaerales bacterium]
MSERVDKSGVRARFRASPPDPQEAAASESIAARILDLEEMKRAECVLGYLALRGEPRLDALLESLRGRGVCVCVPRVDWAGGAMEPAVFEGFDRLICRRHGVREPADEARVVPIEQIHAVLVPGVAFDVHGARLGRGGGFYDRFLARLRPDTLRIGVCFERCVLEKLPVEPWDQSVHVLVTEAAVRRFVPTGK